MLPWLRLRRSCPSPPPSPRFICIFFPPFATFVVAVGAAYDAEWNRLLARTWEGPPATYTVPTTHVPPRTPPESGSFGSRMHQREIASFHRPFPKKHLPPPVKIEMRHGFFKIPADNTRICAEVPKLGL
jgi:hypothetical protein